MSRYVDGYVLPIPAGKIEDYRRIAQKAGELWKEYGALEYFECAGDDLEIDKMLSFKKIAGAGENETVIFAWIVFESREERDRINAAVMADMRLKADMEATKDLFDFKKMAYGGFTALVEL